MPAAPTALNATQRLTERRAGSVRAYLAAGWRASSMVCGTADIYRGRRNSSVDRLTIEGTGNVLLEASGGLCAEDADLNEHARKIQDAPLVDDLVASQRVDECAYGLHLAAGGRKPEEIARVCAGDGHDKGNAIAVDDEVPSAGSEIGKRGKPDLIDPLNRVTSVEDAAGRTDDDGIRRMIGGERG